MQKGLPHEELCKQLPVCIMQISVVSDIEVTCYFAITLNVECMPCDSKWDF